MNRFFYQNKTKEIISGFVYIKSKMKLGFLFLVIITLCSCQDKEVVQSGQPTHFHMEDRGPEIQVTADAEGVKINAKPAGLNVVAKPGHIPATIPHSSLVSTIHDIHGTGIGLSSNLGRIMQPANLNRQDLRYNAEPVMYTDGMNGLAAQGNDYNNNVNTQGSLNPGVYNQPNQFNGNFAGQPGFTGAAAASVNNVANTISPSVLPSGFNGLTNMMQLPADFADYMRWKSGYGDERFFSENHHPHRRHYHPYRRHHHRHRMVNNFYFRRHRYDDDYDDDDDDDYDDY